MAELRAEEHWVLGMIEAALGESVRQHDDGSQAGMHDLDILYTDGRSAAVEVTAAADADCIELWKLVTGAEERWVVPGLQGGWTVVLQPTSRAGRLRKELPDLLGRLEAAGRVSVEAVPRNRRPRDTFADQAGRLGVRRASQGDTAFPGAIYPTIEQPAERTGGIVDPSGSAINPWIRDFLAAPGQADVLAKLRRSNASERHVFVILPGFTTAPFGVVDMLWRHDGAVPVSSPLLPPEVSRVWLASTWRTGSGLRWDPCEGWQRFDTSIESASRRR